MDDGMSNNFRNSIIAEPRLMPPGGFGAPALTGDSSVLRTPFAGNVRSLPPLVPQLPMHFEKSPYGVGGSGYGPYPGMFGNNYGAYGGGGLNYGGGYGGYSGFGAYNRIGGPGMNPLDPESRFIQLAEANSRSAFQSIESIVLAFGNIASMLDSTYFALTSSFRAILGVAANFGRLRGVFAQFWQTFALFRGLSFIYKKILFWLRISDLDPSTAAFKSAFAEALNASTSGPKLPRQGQSPWPVLAFLSFIFTAPYLIMKLLNTVTNTAQEEARNPTKWIRPIETVALYDFQSRNPSELTIRTGERILIAPKEIQNTHGLLNTGWGLATVDGQTSGIVPINYVKGPQELRQESIQRTENRDDKQSKANGFTISEPKLLSAAELTTQPSKQASTTNEADDSHLN